MKYDVFISYSSKDQKVAEGICGFLESNGYRCFVAYRDIPRGVVWAGAIADAIDESQMMVVVFSKDFNISPQTDREIELAAENNIPILTYRITDDKFTGAKKFYLKNLNWIDAFPNPEVYFGSLLKSVIQLVPHRSSPRIKPNNPKFLNEGLNGEHPFTIIKNQIRLNITEGFDLVLNKNIETGYFIGNIPVIELLEYVKNSGSENEETNTYIKSIMDKTGLILSLPVLSLPLSMMFATMAAKVLEDVKGIKAKTFDAILLEINNRYNIFLEKIPNEMRLKINSIHLTEFAVLLDLSKVENSNKLLLDKLKKILTTKL